MELDGLNSDAVTRKFTWGLDLSGSVEGAGGIGGLLATENTAGTTVTTDDRTFIYLYELNGNVGQLVETTTGTDYGTIAAKYEYDPYGKRINTATPGEYDQPYRFSTKPVDDETGLGYWGYRYYSYDLGRWVSRDPIGERGGWNMYSYTDNRPVFRYDWLGLITPTAVVSLGYPLGASPASMAKQKGSVELCCRKTRFNCCAQNLAAGAIGARHCFIRTSTKEAGMGPAGGGRVEEAGGASPTSLNTEITDHAGEGDWPESTCTKLNSCSEACVNQKLSIGMSTGKWGLGNNCNTLVRDILKECGCRNNCRSWITVKHTNRRTGDVFYIRKCGDWEYDPSLPIPPGNVPPDRVTW